MSYTPIRLQYDNTIKNKDKPYTFLPEIWKHIKEYAVPKPYDHADWVVIYTVNIDGFFGFVAYVCGKEMQDFDKVYLVVETDGEYNNTRAYLTKHPDSHRSRRWEWPAELQEEWHGNRLNPITQVDELRSHCYTFRVVTLLAELMPMPETTDIYKEIDPEIDLDDFILQIELTERGYKPKLQDLNGKKYPAAWPPGLRWCADDDPYN